MSSEAFDLAVIGAGPAGMAAAATAAEQGLRVALIEGGRQLGGQYFRQPGPGLTAPWLPKLHHGRSRFERLAARVETSPRIEVLFEHQVWAVEPGFTVLTDRGPVTAADVVLATGSYERVVPFPGWDLPGVFTAGGAQALLKGNLVLAGRRVVVAGTGPLLLPVAAGLATAGAKVLGLFEANRIRGYAKHPLPVLTNPAKLVEGIDFARQFIRNRVPVRSGLMVVEAQGTDFLEAVVVARPDGSGRRRIACDALAVGYGLVPQIDLGLTLGCEHRMLADGTVGLRVDTNQRTSVPGFYAAGETAGIAGVETSLVEGEIAGLAVAAAFARSRARQAAVPDAAAAPADLRRRRDRQRGFADVIRVQHPVPAAWRDHLTPDTLVCRCEEVPARAVTEAVEDLGACDARTVKLLTRAGMGWCQGRVCGYAVACLARRDPTEPPAATDLLAAAKRPLARPVPLGVLAEQDRRNK
ncbi:NAD(P)/FAD-dependent oxidoreductase [Catenulispora subtropica]|uniref:NAD(P)/FAD-dependent oxidoreductase n=1 Tax=Catenulispora subtropica TaxID=450798 RepID=A0ABP5DG95_9ACTN